MSDVLNIDSILQSLNMSETRLKSLTVLDSVDSTNEWCLQQCRQNQLLPFACVANKQTSGRGRRGRQWHSSSGVNITLSLAWGFDCRLDQLGMLSLAIGMAVVDVLRSIGIDDAMLKWPNDVTVNHRKIAGILIETVTLEGQLHAVIGLGLNVDVASSDVSDDAEFDYSLWTDVCQSLGGLPEGGRDQLIANLLRECVIMCERYQQDYDSLSLMFDSHYNALINLPVKVMRENGKTLDGISTGITEKGELRVLIEGVEQVFNSAEVSLHQAAHVV